MLEITPHTKVLDILETYPHLEDVLFSISPAFEKLKNPILRKTVAQVATVQHASKVAGIPLAELLNTLRKGAGLDVFEVQINDNELSKIPEWLDKRNIVKKLNAVEIIDAGGSPMSDIIKISEELKEKEIFEFSTPFYPAPILEILEKKSFKVFSENKNAVVCNYVMKA